MPLPRFCLAALMSIALSTEAVANDISQAAPDPSLQQAAINDDVGSTGAFPQSIPFTLPAFHGIAPGFRLSYSSQNRNTSGTDAILGVGWSLGGLSEIRRVSEGRGLPWWNGKRPA